MKKNMKKFLTLILCLGLVIGLMAGCGGETAGEPEPAPGGETAEEPAAGEQTAAPTRIVVGVTPKPHGEILEVAKPLLAEQNIDLEIRPFTDYVLLNPALKDKQIDANFFQHIPYLEDYNSQNNADLVWTVKVHAEPMGVYSETITDIGAIQEGAVVAIPNDATNGGRALLLLEKAGLITLTDGAGLEATILDISDNPKNIDIMELEAASLPRTLGEVDVAVINTNYALEANLNPREDAIFIEDKDSPYVNVLVVRAEDKDNEDLQKLAQALNTEAVRNFINENYGGAVVPAF